MASNSRAQTKDGYTKLIAESYNLMAKAVRAINHLYWPCFWQGSKILRGLQIH